VLEELTEHFGEVAGCGDQEVARHPRRRVPISRSGAIAFARWHRNRQRSDSRYQRHRALGARVEIGAGRDIYRRRVAARAELGQPGER
jgi:hypothetical protein